MKLFLEEYGTSIFTLIILAIMFQIAPTMGAKIENSIVTKVGSMNDIKINGIDKNNNSDVETNEPPITADQFNDTDCSARLKTAGSLAI